MLDPTIAVAALALAGTVVSAFFQYRATVNRRKSQETEEANKRAEAAEKALEKANREKEREELRAEIESLRKEIKQVHDDVQFIGTRVDQYKTTTNRWLNEHEEKLDKMIDAFAHNARMYSGIMRMHVQTESRMQALVDVETISMKFANETAVALNLVGNLVVHALSDKPEDAARLQEALDKSAESQKQFITNVLNAQQDFFKQVIPNSDTINAIETESDRARKPFEDIGISD